MTAVNIVHKTQRLLVDMPTRTVTIIMAGPPGPTGPRGPTGSGAGGFNHAQPETPSGTLTVGDTWYKTDTGQAYVWYDSFWIQFAPNPIPPPPPPDPFPNSYTQEDFDMVLSRLVILEERLTQLENP